MEAGGFGDNSCSQISKGNERPAYQYHEVRVSRIVQKVLERTDKKRITITRMKVDQGNLHKSGLSRRPSATSLHRGSKMHRGANMGSGGDGRQMSSNRPGDNEAFGTQKHEVSPEACYRSNKEKLDLLERIDQLLRDQLVQESDVSKVKSVLGTCEDICPEKERYLRIERNLCSPYEMDEHRRPQHHLMIKEYSRSSADRKEDLAHELRPSRVLVAAMDFMLSTCLHDIDHERVSDWFDFAWNRTRAMRKEVSIQELKDAHAIGVVERCARFHIACAHQLCEETHRCFDPKINNENLEKTMKTLLDIYDDTEERLDNEAEFRSYHIILNINKSTDVLTELAKMESSVRASLPVSRAMEAFCAVQSSNFARFFQVTSKCTYLQAALLHRYFTQIRLQALDMCRRAYRSERGIVRLPCDKLIGMLQLNDQTELEHFATYNNIEISDGIVMLSKTVSDDEERASMPQLRSALVDSMMRGRSLRDVISGGATELLSHHESRPTFSFDPEGRYVGPHRQLLTNKQQLKPKKQDATFSSDMSGSRAPSSGRSAQMASVLAQRGVPNELVKVVTRELITSSIGEILHEVAEEVQHKAIFSRITMAAADVLLEEVLALETVSVAQHALEQETAARQHQEQKMREDLERRARISEMLAEKERMISEEKRRLERMEAERLVRKEEEARLMRLKEECGRVVCEGLVDEVVGEVVAQTTARQLHEARREAACEKVASCLIDEVVGELSRGASAETRTEARSLRAAEEGVERSRRRNIFHRWQACVARKMRRRRMLREDFPVCPPPRYQMPKRPIFHDPKFSVSDAKRRRQVNEIMERRDLEEATAMKQPFPIARMIRDGFADDMRRRRNEPWKLIVVVYGRQTEFTDWLKLKLAIPEGDDCSYEESERGGHVCLMVEAEQLAPHHLFAASAALIVRFDNSRQDLAAVMSQLSVNRLPSRCSVHLYLQSATGKEDDYIRDIAQVFHLAHEQLSGGYVHHDRKLRAALERMTAKRFEEEESELVGDSVRNYFETSLMDNYFTPMRACAAIVYNNNTLQPLSADDVISSFNYVMEARTRTLMDAAQASRWPLPHAQSLARYSSAGGSRWNDPSTLSKIKSASEALRLPAWVEYDQDDEDFDNFKTHLLAYTDRLYASSGVDQVVTRPKVLRLVEEHRERWYDDIDFLSRHTPARSFPYVRLVELMADALFAEHIYARPELGCLRVYYPSGRDEEDEEVVLPAAVLARMRAMEFASLQDDAATKSSAPGDDGTAREEEGNVDSSLLAVSKCSFVVEQRTERDWSLDLSVEQRAKETCLGLTSGVDAEKRRSDRFERYLRHLLRQGEL